MGFFPSRVRGEQPCSINQNQSTLHFLEQQMLQVYKVLSKFFYFSYYAAFFPQIKVQLSHFNSLYNENYSSDLAQYLLKQLSIRYRKSTTSIISTADSENKNRSSLFGVLFFFFDNPLTPRT